MKIKDPRGIELVDDCYKYIFKKEGIPDMVIFIRTDKVDEFIKLTEFMFFEAHGYNEIII